MPTLDPRLAELLRQLRGGALPPIVKPQPPAQAQPVPTGPGRPVDVPVRPKLPGEPPP